MRPPGRAMRALEWALVLAPPIAALGYIATYGVNGAHWDHLSTTELFDRHDRGALTIAYLLSPHNEHRKLVPRLIVLGLGLLTRWNNLAEMYFQWCLLAITALVLFRVVAQHVERGTGWRTFAFAPVTLVLFNLRQHQSMLMGDGMITYAGTLFIVTALYLLAGASFSRWTFAAACAAALAASFSHGNGLLVWPIGLLAIAARYGAGESRETAVRIGAWLLLAAAVALVYTSNAFVGDVSPTINTAWQRPPRTVAYFVMLVGGAVTPIPWLAAVAGAGVVALAIALGIVVWRSGRIPHAIPFGVWLIAVAFGSAALFSLGRSYFGLTQALQSRYTVFSGLALVGLYLATLELRSSTRLRVAAVMVVLAAAVLGNADGLMAGPEERGWRARDAFTVYAHRYMPDSAIAVAFPFVGMGRGYMEALERMKLNVFADPHVQPERLALTSVPPAFFVDTVNGRDARAAATHVVTGDDAVLVMGWAADTGARRPAAAVFGVIDGRLYIPTIFGAERPDVAAAFGSPALTRVGFLLFFAARLLEPGTHDLSLRIALADGRTGYDTPVIARIERR